MIRIGLAAVLCLVLPPAWALETNETQMIGKTTPECVNRYNEVFVNKFVPKRRYMYFHEHKESNVELQWRIVGGQRVDISEAPFTVLYGPNCGGCLIAPEWVLTAAHCRSTENVVVAGATRVSEGDRYSICAHFLHPMWSERHKLHFHDYDYQLLLLESPVPVSDSTRPIAIGSLSAVVPGAMVSVTGWGRTHVKQKSMHDVLRQVSVPIIPSMECKLLPHSFYATITPRMFCAGYHNGSRDSCQGDSGGPAVLDNKLVGLVSFGVSCAEKEKPGVYAIVPMARSWIREVTGLPL